jgi:hypothetical protein
MTSQLSQSISDQLNNRFASLVQPIKDLAANWDIDIAENLSEYLEDLDHLRITVDGSKTQLNFAEAALLIQGSTAVYSKKVEYLHQLVLKSLEFITQKRSNKIGKDSSNSGKITDANDRSYDEDFLLNFGELSEAKDLLLDHLIEEGDNIDLPAKEISHHVANYSTDSVICTILVTNEVNIISVTLLEFFRLKAKQAAECRKFPFLFCTLCCRTALRMADPRSSCFLAISWTRAARCCLVRSAPLTSSHCRRLLRILHLARLMFQLPMLLHLRSPKQWIPSTTSMTTARTISSTTTWTTTRLHSTSPCLFRRLGCPALPVRERERGMMW